MKPRWHLAPAEHLYGSRVNVQVLRKFTEHHNNRSKGFIMNTPLWRFAGVLKGITERERQKAGSLRTHTPRTRIFFFKTKTVRFGKNTYYKYFHHMLQSKLQNLQKKKKP
jgi:hypothetical protein